jgi:hypothetical protein
MLVGNGGIGIEARGHDSDDDRAYCLNNKSREYIVLYLKSVRRLSMALVTDSTGLVWLEPKHIDMMTIEADVLATSIDATAAKYRLTAAEWREVAEGVGQMYHKGARIDSALLNAVVNLALTPHALSLPAYCTVKEAREIDALIFNASPDVEGIKKAISHIVFDPRMRAIQLMGRFMKVPLFAEFGYLIDAATLSYFRGNIPSAFMTLVPIIEGILLRWQGYPAPGMSKPSFQDTKDFVANTATREPHPALPIFFDSWAAAATEIINTNLYRHTADGPAVDYFNRHLALHLLADVTFGTRDNVLRLFVLIDLLSDLYICEKRSKDPRFSVKEEELDPHVKAYKSALASQADTGQPEKILAATHARCK